jgi:hypothetical protein
MALQHNWEREVLFLNSGLKQDHQAIKRVKEAMPTTFFVL